MQRDMFYSTVNSSAWVCPLCGRHTETQAKLRNHIEYCRRAANPKFQCNVCMKTFAYKKDLEKHIRTHTGEKPYHCSYCSYCFADRSSLVKHRRRYHQPI